MTDATVGAAAEVRGDVQGAVLIVEDDEDIRRDLAEILEEEGYHVATACDGLAALRYLHSSPAPCLLLLDLMMPSMDGWQLRAELLKDATLAAIPVVLLSAGGNVAEEARALGAVAYVTKPIDLDALIGLIDNHC